MIDLKPACRRMADVLAGVTNDQLTHATPCTDYTVRDLINHISEVSQGFAALARKDHAVVGNIDNTDNKAMLQGGDWCGPVTAQVLALGESWADPTAWQGRFDAGGVELSNELWGRIALTEMVVHGWDLATATGQPFDLPGTTLRACLEHVAAFVPQAPVPALWGPAVDIPDAAPLLDQIIAITGRTP